MASTVELRQDLSDNARSVAIYIVTTHVNGHTEKAWPSYQTIADATGKSVKTIQRAVRELEAKGWFEVQRQFSEINIGKERRNVVRIGSFGLKGVRVLAATSSNNI